VREITNSVKEKKKDLEREKENKKQARKKAIEEIENTCNDTFGDMKEDLPSVQKAMKEFAKKINKTPLDDLSSVITEAQKFLYGERNKIKRLYWDVDDL
jgi:molecular chaperone DnaK (HSP70)